MVFRVLFQPTNKQTNKKAPVIVGLPIFQGVLIRAQGGEVKIFGVFTNKQTTNKRSETS